MEITSQGLFEEVDRVVERFGQVHAPLTREQKEWSEPGKWSALKCIDHMNVTIAAYLPQIRQAIAEGRRQDQNGEEPFRVRFLERQFLRILEPPVRLRVRAPKPFQPSSVPDSARVEERFTALRNELREAIRSAEGLDLSKIRLSSPAFSWFRIGLGSAFAAMAAHDRRHLWQVEQITRSPGFPS